VSWLSIEVVFTDWVRDANLRHAAFLGSREVTDPRQVRREPTSA
jgi:ATP-dependent DNA ligase